jgi:hypothetical protein
MPVAAAPALAAPPPLFSTSASVLSGSSGTTQSGHLARDGLPSTCASPKSPAPSVDDPATPRHTSVIGTSGNTLNGTSNPICVTVTTTSHCAPNQIESASYLGTFTPSNIRANYAGDLGASPDASGEAYSFSVPPGSQFRTVISEVAAGTGCSSFDVSAVPDRPWAASGAGASGAAIVGKTMTGSHALWMGTPTITSQWLRCDEQTGANCVDIPGATGITYVVADDDIGHSLRFRSIATDGNSSTAESDQHTVGIPLMSTSGTVGTGDPTQTGRLNRGGPISQCDPPKANPGLFIATGARPYEDLVLQNLTNEPMCVVAAAANPSCTPPAAVNVFVAGYAGAFDPANPATNWAGDPAASGQTANSFAFPVPPGSPFHVVLSLVNNAATDCPYTLDVGTVAPAATALPVITGAPGAGPLATSDGTWSGTASFARAWRRCDEVGAACSDIPGATGSAYTPTSEDNGHTLRARITASQGGKSASADSAATALVSGIPAPPSSEPPGGSSAPPGGNSPPPDGNPPPVGNPPPTADKIAPKLTLKLSKRTLKRVLKDGFVPVLATCDEACKVSSKLLVDSKVARKLHLAGLVKVGAGSLTLAPNRARTMKVKLTPKARKGLAKAKTVRFTIRTGARDTSGNVAKAGDRKVTLKR